MRSLTPVAAPANDEPLGRIDGTPYLRIRDITKRARHLMFTVFGSRHASNPPYQP